MDVAQVLGDVADRAEGVARLETPLLVVDVARGIARHRRAGAALHVVDHVHRRGVQLLAHEPVDRAQQPTLARREFLAVVAPSAGVHDRGKIVGADVALDELARGELDALGPQRRRMQVVEHDHVDAAVGGLHVVADVRLHRLRRKQRPLDALERDVDQRKRRHLLRLAVFEHLEIFRLEVGDELAVLVQDARVDFDVVHFRAEGDWRLLRRLGLALRAQGDRGYRKRDEQDEQSLCHKVFHKSFKLGRQPQL